MNKSGKGMTTQQIIIFGGLAIILFILGWQFTGGGLYPGEEESTVSTTIASETTTVIVDDSSSTTDTETTTASTTLEVTEGVTAELTE